MADLEHIFVMAKPVRDSSSSSSSSSTTTNNNRDKGEALSER